MQKAYSRVNWENYPSEQTALNESNLNRMDYAIDEIDNRVITLDTVKANISDVSAVLKSWDINEQTGVVTMVLYDDTIITRNTNIGKIATNFTYDRTTQKLILTYPDGTTEEVDLSALIQDNEFQDSATITTSVVGGVVTSSVKQNSITDSHLRTNYLADIRVSEANAAASQSSAEASAINSRSWATGDTQSRPGEDEDNAKYYSEVASGQAQLATDAMTQAQDLVDTATARLTGLQMHVDYDDGCLYYESESGIALRIDDTTGNLMYEVITI